MANILSISQFDQSVANYGREGVGYLLEKSPVLRMLEAKSAFEVDATEFNFIIATQAATLQARARGAGYNATAITPGTYQSGAQRFHGDSVLIDNTDLKDQQLGLRDVDTMIAKKAKASFRSFSKAYDAQLMNGTGGTNTLYGLAAIVNGTDDLPGHTGVKGFVSAATYSAFAGALSFDLRNPANLRYTEEMLMELVLSVPDANVIFMPNAMFIAYATIGKKLNLFTQTLDDFGKTILKFGEIDVRPMSDATMPFTEDNSDESLQNCSSLYIARLSEGSLSFVTNSGLEVTELDPSAKQSKGFNYEIRGAWKIEESDAILRVGHLSLSRDINAILGEFDGDFSLNINPNML